MTYQRHEKVFDDYYVVKTGWNDDPAYDDGHMTCQIFIRFGDEDVFTGFTLRVPQETELAMVYEIYDATGVVIEQLAGHPGGGFEYDLAFLRSFYVERIVQDEIFDDERDYEWCTRFVSRLYDEEKANSCGGWQDLRIGREDW